MKPVDHFQDTTRAEVISLRPLLLRDRDAAVYLGRSPSWIRARRAADVKVQREGRAPVGPTWVVIEKSIFYRLSDLDAWVERVGRERGVVEFSNRGGATTSPSS